MPPPERFQGRIAIAFPLGNVERLAPVLDLPSSALRALLRRRASLRTLGLVEYEGGYSDLENFVQPSSLLRELLEAAPTTVDELLALLIEPAPPAAWHLEAFPHLAAALPPLRETLATAASTGAVGVNALFHGPPGTGKTAFAELLAEALDRELVACTAGERLSPYVGETERNLARLFRDTDPTRTILLLDEVDSFLSDRGQARRSWERTQVNELLQQLERYPGLFVAATNRMTGLDAAALRRQAGVPGAGPGAAAGAVRPRGAGRRGGAGPRAAGAASGPAGDADAGRTSPSSAASGRCWARP